jgi:hypothetical protein
MSNTRLVRPPRLDHDGFTLIELLIYTSLAVVVLLIVGGQLITALTAENTVRDSTTASNDGQLVSMSVGQGIRNASAIAYIPATATLPEVLIVRTVGTETPQNWFCQAWSFRAGQIRTKTSSAPIGTSLANIANWTLLGDGIQQVAGGPIFAKSARQVTVNLDVTTGKGQPVRIRTSATSRQPLPPTGIEVSAPCF